MQDFLFGTFQLLSLVLYLFLSAVLVYHRLIGRWVNFSFAFFLVYGIGSFLFFGIWPLPFPTKEAFQNSPYFLFFIGGAAVLGFGFGRGLGLKEILGIQLVYLFAVSVFVYLLEGPLGVDFLLPGKGSVEGFLLYAPYIGFYAGTPMVFGYCMYRDMSLHQTAGVMLIFLFCLLLAIVGGTNYFSRPFGFFYEMRPHARAWIEIATVFAAVLGLLGVIGYGLLHGLKQHERLGALVLYLAVIGPAVVLVHLTIGYEHLWNVLGMR